MRNLYSLLFCFLIGCTVAPQPSPAATVTLAWDANSEPDIHSYLLHYGIVSGAYTFSTNVGNVTTFTVQNLLPATWYFAVSAMNTGGLQGPKSQEISVSIPSAQLNFPPAISNIANVVLSSNVPTRIVINVWDIETPPEQLALSAVSSNQQVVPNAWLIFTPGTNAWERILSIQALPRVSGQVVITVSVSDGRDISTMNFTASVIAAPGPVLTFRYNTGMEQAPTPFGPWTPVWGPPLTLWPTNFYRMR